MTDDPPTPDAPPNPRAHVFAASFLSLSLLLAGGVALVQLRRAPRALDEVEQYELANQSRQAGFEAFDAWNSARRAEDHPTERALHETSLRHLQTYIDLMNGILENHLDAEGFIEEAYEGYEAEMSEAAVRIVDLERASQFPEPPTSPTPR